MKRCALKSAAELLLIGSVIAALIGGCAATQPYSRRGSSNAPNTESLHGFLDRWDSWNSFGAHIKLKLTVRDSTFKARGHVLYMIGERYEIGFARPYNRILGNLYISPDQLVYWGINSEPEVYTAADTIRLSAMLQANVPNWNPRDLLPFPVAGRTGGFQVDSMSLQDELRVTGHSNDARYVFAVTNRSGSVSEERIDREGYDPIIKRYSRHTQINGWPLARRVVCQDTAGTVSLTWYISGATLDAAPRFESSSEGNGSNTGIPHE